MSTPQQPNPATPRHYAIEVRLACGDTLKLSLPVDSREPHLRKAIADGSSKFHTQDELRLTDDNYAAIAEGTPLRELARRRGEPIRISVSTYLQRVPANLQNTTGQTQTPAGAGQTPAGAGQTTAGQTPAGAGQTTAVAVQTRAVAGQTTAGAGQTRAGAGQTSQGPSNSQQQQKQEEDEDDLPWWLLVVLVPLKFVLDFIGVDFSRLKRGGDD